jgi:hypothetical protein
MKRPWPSDTAFRATFLALVTAALLLWFWASTERPPEPSRVDWPTTSHSSPP